MPPRRLAAIAVMLAVFAAAGCSSYPMESLFSKQDADVDKTGSSGGSGNDRGAQATPPAQPSEADLAYAREAATEVVGRPGKDNSVPWKNPQTGAGGNILPLAAVYSDGGAQCRDFLASYVRAGAQTWLQGSACLSNHGDWEVKNLRPLEPS